MTKSGLWIAIGLLGAVLAPAPVRVAPQFSPERIKAHVAFLSDDLLEGREAGTRGHEIAARYVAAQFAQLGVKPGGPDGSYFQDVPLIESSRTGAAPTLTLTSPRGRRTLRHGHEVMVTGPLRGGTAAVSGAMVFVGYGIADAALGEDDYKGLDAAGKIVVALWGYPRGMDSEIGAYLQSEQRRTAAAHGAKALILVPTRLSAAAFPWDRLRLRAERPIASWRQGDGTPFDAAGGLSASLYIAPDAAASLFDGAARTLEQVLDAAGRSEGRPQGMALAVRGSLRVSTVLRQFSSPEVIGVVKGSDPRLEREYVALMAHVDHIGMRPPGAGDRINNGTLDNAAGVATLIEVARALATSPDRPRRSILLIANTAEEKGLVGADYFARHPTVPIGQITAAIDLDMPMLLYDFTDVVGYGAGHSTLEPVLRRAAAAMGVALSPDPMPEQAVFVRSDHYAMARQGVPAVMLATGMANGGQAAWARFLSTRYHQPSDDMSQPLDWAAGAKFAELNYRLLRALADSDDRPRWFEGDYFGNRFAPQTPKAERSAGR